MAKNIKIGTRGSKLALIQANYVLSLLRKYDDSNGKKYNFTLTIIKTTGDKIVDKPLYDIGGKALFVKELEEAMLMNKIDIAIHSMKDIPAFYPTDLGFYAYLPREDARDALISKKYNDISSLPKHAIIGTSSVRRIIQLKHLRPDLEIRPLRGNVDSRLHKVNIEEFDAIILAVAGLKRLGISDDQYHIISHETILPAISQGAIGIECKNDRMDLHHLLKQIDHIHTHKVIDIERNFQIEINGSCRTPMAAYTNMVSDNLINMQFLYGSEDLHHIVRVNRTVNISDAPDAAIECAKECKILIRNKRG